jgi:hypothetical protein
MAIKLIDLEQPLEPVVFPNGKELAVVPLDAAGYQLWEEVQRTRSDEAALALLRRCVPEATDEDLMTLTPRMVAAIVAHARYKIDLVLASIKNGSAPAEATETTPRASGRRSSRTTSRATSSRG